MKNFAVLWLCLMSFVVVAKDASVITFAGLSHYKAFKAQNDYSKVIEYVPQGQTVDNWTSLVGIWRYYTIDDPAQFAKSLGFQVKHQEGAALDIEYVDGNPNDVVLPMVLIEKGPNGYIAETNVWRFTKVKGKRGIVAAQYATRDYAANFAAGVTIRLDLNNIIGELKNIPIHSYY